MRAVSRLRDPLSKPVGETFNPRDSELPRVQKVLQKMLACQGVHLSASRCPGGGTTRRGFGILFDTKRRPQVEDICPTSPSSD
jgi:hypothetical protein